MLGLHFTPVCVLLLVCSLHFTPGPQSAVLSPQSASYTDRASISSYAICGWENNVIRYIFIPFSIKFVVVVKICKAWVRSQLRWAWNWLKLNVTSSSVLRIIIHWLSRVSNRVFLSRNPEGYFWHPISRAYFQSRISPRFRLKIPNPEPQIREIPHPEKLIGDPHYQHAGQDVGFTCRALKHSIRQHKLDLNLSKTKQPLPIITNSHLNFRNLTASANL